MNQAYGLRNQQHHIGGKAMEKSFAAASTGADSERVCTDENFSLLPIRNRGSSLAQDGQERDGTPDWKERAKKTTKQKCACSRDYWAKLLLSFFPFVHWIREYDWTKDVISDVIAGLTVGIMSIPQGISYAGVAGVPPQFGLYSNLVPTMMYFFLGSSRLAAIGPAAVVCIMLGNSRHKHIPDSRSDLSPGCFPPALSVNTENGTEMKNLTYEYLTYPKYEYTEDMGTRIFENPDCFTSWQLVISMTMLMGLTLILMGVLQLGFISNYLCDYMIGGFTSGAAVHVLTSQLDYVFGTQLPWHTGVGKLVFTFADLIVHIGSSVPGTVAISCVCISILMLIKELVNPAFQRAVGVPFPGELILIIVGTAISHFGRFEDTLNIEVVHSVTAGFPRPLFPRFDLMRRIALDALAVAVVLYSLSISLAKLYAKRNGYKIDANQEFFAYGIINVAGSVFQCFAAGQIVSRSIVYESSGAKSQFAGMLGAMLVFVTIMWIAPLLVSLPKCILGSIIVVSCIQLLKQLKHLKPLYLTSKVDFSIYLFTFLAVLLLDVIEGLAASIVFAALVALFRCQWPKICEFRRTGEDSKTPRIKVFRFDEPLDFNGAIHFLRLIYATCGLGPDEVLAKKQEFELAAVASPTISTINAHRIAIIIDCSSFHYIDSMGIRALKQVDEELKKRSINLYFAECSGVLKYPFAIQVSIHCVMRSSHAVTSFAATRIYSRDNLETLQLAKFFNGDRTSRSFGTIQEALTVIPTLACEALACPDRLHQTKRLLPKADAANETDSFPLRGNTEESEK